MRHRTVRTKGAPSQKTAKLMVSTLVGAASKTSRKREGTNPLPSVIEGVDGAGAIARTDADHGRAGCSRRITQI